MFYIRTASGVSGIRLRKNATAQEVEKLKRIHAGGCTKEGRGGEKG